MSDLQPPTFGNGTVTQCEPITVSWEGGEFPVRVEAFYQSDPQSDWKSTGSLPAEAADSNIVEWIANVPAGSIAWITLVDHSGTYKQSSQGTIVAPSNDDSCLDNSKTAAIVTQTVFMSSGGRVGTGLDDKSLLILTVVFAVAFFTAAAGVVYLFSKLRQTRRTRGGQGSRFALTNEDFDSMHSGESLHEGPEYGTGYMAASSAARRQNSRAARSSLGGSTIAPTRDSTYGSNDKAVKEVESRRMSRISESASMLAPAESYDALTSNLDTEKGTRSPVSPRSEHNPFLDPPIPSTAEGGPSTAMRPRPAHAASAHSTVIRYPSLDHNSYTEQQHLQRSAFSQPRSRADTLSSATSMQLFDTTEIGGLRIANDPNNIPTPQLSRANTINTFSSETSSQYPASRSDPVSPLSANGDGAHTRLIDHASGRPGTLSSSRSVDNESFVSSTSATGSTADHYASEPHSSKGWLPPKG